MWDLLKSKVSNFVSKIKEAVVGVSEEKNELHETEHIPATGGKEEVQQVSVKPGKKSFAKRDEVGQVSVTTRKEESFAKRDEGLKIKVGIKEKVLKKIVKKIRFDPGKIEDIVADLEFALIQSDVHPDVAREVCEKVKERLSNSEFSEQDLEAEVKRKIEEILIEESFGRNDGFDLVKKVGECKKPCKILFVGPNGAGKTTTIAKVGRLLMDNGYSVIISASDTFRAAAIEQTEEHASRLGIKVIKHNYGGDPAAVAYDAVKHAEVKKIDVVLIDSAGRQDTNYNLMRELEKINRVIKPDIKMFVGEAIAGNSLYQQVDTYNKSIGIDGIILTKADCDSKGGVAISIFRETGVPILYLGTGQGYNDLEQFNPKMITSRIV
ncbi:MAG: signal recognition particle-docking protein FtsY [Candidatus Micrarchaeia archaeon]